jgi:hypothetical protein
MAKISCSGVKLELYAFSLIAGLDSKLSRSADPINLGLFANSLCLFKILLKIFKRFASGTQALVFLEVRQL